MKLSTSLAALASLFVLSVVRADWLNNHCVSVMHTCNTAEQHDGYSACMCNLRWGKNNYPCRQGCYNSLYEPGLEPEKIRNNCDLLCDHGDVCVSLPSSCQPY